MGTWGPKIYEDDLAQDIKEEYEELIEEGKNNEEAIQEICLRYKEEIEDVEESSLFWMAFADILYEHKNLTKYVKEKALKEIESGKNLEKWKREASEQDYIKRKSEIEKLREKLEIYNEKDNKKEKKHKEISENEKYKNQWEIGDTYAYKIENTEYKGQYLILRKVQDTKYYNNTRNQSAIVYVQITTDKQIPKNEEQINQLEYIIMGNKANVKYKYRMQLYQIPRKKVDKLIYIGNYKNIEMPQFEYEEEEINLWLESLKNIEYLISKIKALGTSKNPIYKEPIPENIDDGYIRFLMKARYYEENLDITPPENAIVKDNALLYISLVDSLMIGGFVIKNRVGLKVKDMKQEAYKRIEELRNVINGQKVEQKEKDRRIKILEDLKKRIEDFEGIKLDIDYLIENMK